MITRFVCALSICVSLFVSAGCSKENPKGEPASSGTTQAAGHAPKDAKPGSHEDWCGEHAVPESQCTRCNPSLTAAFKATGDWCADHGLPKSQCTKCNPDLKIVRPEKGK